MPYYTVEVISKSTAKRDEKAMFAIYESEQVKYYVLVYPNEFRAKIFRLENGKYMKAGDFSKETFEFEASECQAAINFEQVFKKFRK